MDSAALPRTAETPSGKGSSDENFPVGSLLLPARLRPHVAAFYAFARAIDDIADNPALAPEDKIARLDGFDQALTGETDEPAFAKGVRIRESCRAAGVDVQHCRDLITAFKQDAVKSRYEDWADLLGYCRYSASPVGRYLLELHGEPSSKWRYSDPLCDLLQVINHLQDCRDDYRALDRVYLPQEWLAAAGATVEDLDRPSASPGLRRVIDQCLDGVDELMETARQLPGALSDRRLAMESGAIVRLAQTLARRLRREDPLARRVALSKPAFLLHALTGAASGLIAA